MSLELVPPLDEPVHRVRFINIKHEQRGICATEKGARKAGEALLASGILTMNDGKSALSWRTKGPRI